MNNIQITGLILITAFYLLYLGKQFLLRRKGIISNRLSKGNKPRKSRRIEFTLQILTFFMAGVQYLNVFFHYRISLFSTSSIYIQIGEIVITFAGILFFLLAITSMKTSWRAGIDSDQNTKMVTQGIYRYSRNPAFVGFDLFYIGICMLFPSVLLIILTILTIVFFHLQILEEEKFLPTTFGKEYHNYKKQVRRYL